MTETEMRAAFEAWVKTRCLAIYPDGNGSYSPLRGYYAWEAWREATRQAERRWPAIPAHGDWVEWSDPVTGERLTGTVIEVDPETWTLGLRDVTRGNLHRMPARLVTRVAAPASDDE